MKKITQNEKIKKKKDIARKNFPLKSNSFEIFSDPILPDSFMDSLLSDISELYDEKENSKKNLEKGSEHSITGESKTMNLKSKNR